MVRPRTISPIRWILPVAAALSCTAANTNSQRARDEAARAAAAVATVDPVRFEGSFPRAPGRRRATLTIAGDDREVALVVPDRLIEHPPLLVILHGTRGDGAGVIEECGALGLSHTENAVIAAPDARVMPSSDWDHPEQSGERWWETHPLHDPDRNADLMLVRAIIAAAKRDYGVDPARVYVMGHSNGAFFALTVAMTLGDQLAGVALNSGGLVRCATTGGCHFRAGRVADCARYPTMPGWCRCEGPALPMEVSAARHRFPVVISHGTDDPDVSVQYACALEGALRGAGFNVTLQLRPGDGHFCDSDFVEHSWRVLTGNRIAALK